MDNNAMSMDQSRRKRKFDDEHVLLLRLPMNVRDLILQKLSVRDFIRSSAVCTSLRCSANAMFSVPEPRIPWLVLELDVGEQCSIRFLNLLDRKVYKFAMPPDAAMGPHLTSGDGWLISSEVMYNPFSGDVLSLPKYRHLVPSHLVLSEFPRRGTYSSKGRCGTSSQAKEYIVVASTKNLLVYCRPNYFDWSFVPCAPCADQDMLVSNGLIYVLTSSDNLKVYDLLTGKTKFDIVLDIEKKHCMQTGYLVESCDGDILVVIRIPESRTLGDTDCLQTVGFQVYKLEMSRYQKWVKVESLGDQALFVGKTCSKSLHAMDFMHGIRGNCIYFTCDSSNLSNKSVHQDIGVFSLDDGSVEPFLPGDFQRTRAQPCEMLWVMSDLNFCQTEVSQIISKRVELRLENCLTALESSQLISAPSSAQYWSPPMAEFYKINTDAVVVDEQHCGLGVIIRDAAGAIMLSAHKRVPNCADIDIALSQALFYGMQLAFYFDFLKVQCETKSLLRVPRDRSERFKSIGEEIDHYRGFFSCCLFSHASRDANKAARCLAGLTRAVSEEIILVEDAPEEVKHLVYLDVAALNIYCNQLVFKLNNKK